jgi:hypothetical protein
VTVSTPPARTGHTSRTVGGPLVVVYDTGSLAPTRLAATAARYGHDPLFVVAGSEHAREMLPVLRTLGTVIDGSAPDLRRTLQRHRPAGITTFSEYQLPRTTHLAAALGLPYHAPEDLDAIISKDAQRERLTAAGVGTVRFRTIRGPWDPKALDEAVDQVGLPAVIKPVIGVSSRNTFPVTSRAQCRAAVAQLLGGPGPGGDADGAGDPNDAGSTEGPNHPSETEVILEELLVGRRTEPPWGDYIAVDCVATPQGVRPLFVSSKFALAEPFRERGAYGGPSVVPAAEIREVEMLACRAVAALNIRVGIADVEIKLTDAGPRVLEVNGRLGGWVDDLAARCGHADPADVAVRAALGLPVDVAPRTGDGPIVFHYVVVPPVTAHRVRTIRNVQALRKIRNVDRVAVLTRPGASVDWRIGAAANVAAVLGEAASHDELAETVREIETVEWIDYD